MSPFTTEQKKAIIQAIKDDGFMVSGWCKRNNICAVLFYEVLNNQKGVSGKRPAPECDRIIQCLINDNYLAAPEQQSEAA